jgi:hypothetical protein
MRHAHPNCEVCQHRRAHAPAARAWYAAAGACVRCGTPVSRYKLCALCRMEASQRASRGRARRADGAHS